MPAPGPPLSHTPQFAAASTSLPMPPRLPRLTTDANVTVSPFHDRMPVILDRAAIDVWLDQATLADRLQELLAPAADDLLEAVAVSKLVNSPKNDGPECIEPAGAA